MYKIDYIWDMFFVLDSISVVVKFVFPSVNDMIKAETNQKIICVTIMVQKGDKFAHSLY